MSNSSTGGYLNPITPVVTPNRLTLIQFIQTVLVGISGLPGTSVRPKWQVAPGKQPDLPTSWIAFGIRVSKPDANSYVGMDAAGVTTSQRHEGLEISCSIYGPDALEICDLIRDGFQIQQNLEALTKANMGFTEILDIIHIPELINERWLDRYEMPVVLRREVLRSYPILPIVSANGKIHSVIGNEEYLLNWQTGT